MVGGEEWIMNVGTKAAAAYEKKGMKSPFATPRENGMAILKTNASYLSSGPVVAMIWQGAHAVEVVRKLTGGTEPRTSDVGTIRGDYMLDSYQMADAEGRSIRNLIHASGTPEEAEKEIPIWFEKDELVKYHIVQEKILYDSLEHILA